MPALISEADSQLSFFMRQTAVLKGTFIVSLPVASGGSSSVTTLTVAVSEGAITAKAFGDAPLNLHESIVFMPAATPDIAGHYVRLRRALVARSEAEHKVILYCNCGYGESTTDNVYGGGALIISDGAIRAEARRFTFDEQLLTTNIDLEALSAAEDVSSMPFLPDDQSLDDYYEEILDMQATALATRLTHIHGRKVILGISGGLDSTLALLACVRTFDRLGYDRKDIFGITMPGFGTSGRTYHNAIDLMESLGVTLREIPIREACTQHFKDIGLDASKRDVTYENSQARERTQILMDLANMENALVIGTGDLSEMALGWCTYNGDHMSMYGVNGSIPKTLMQYIVRHIARTSKNETVRKVLLDIVETPISPELVPAETTANGKPSAVIGQKTESIVGPYELHDFFLWHFLVEHATPRRIYTLARRAFGGPDGKYSDEELKHWLYTFFRRFFSQQFKRSCMPDGPQITDISLSPRGALNMPSDASASIWLKECEEL